MWTISTDAHGLLIRQSRRSGQGEVAPPPSGNRSATHRTAIPMRGEATDLLASPRVMAPPQGGPGGFPLGGAVWRVVA
jgi:hypothetical protein